MVHVRVGWLAQGNPLDYGRREKKTRRRGREYIAKKPSRTSVHSRKNPQNEEEKKKRKGGTQEEGGRLEWGGELGPILTRPRGATNQSKNGGSRTKENRDWNRRGPFLYSTLLGG